MTTDELIKQAEEASTDDLIKQAENKTTKSALQKTGEGALQGTAIPQIGRLYNYATGKEKADTPEKVGELVKDIGTLPINVLFSPAGAVGGAVMGGTGADEAIGEQIAKLPPSAQKYMTPLLELASLIPGMKAAKGLKGMSGVKEVVKSQLPIVTKKLDVSKVGQGIEKGVGMETEQMGNVLKEAAETEVKRIKKDVYAPVRGEVGKIGAPIKVGIETAKDITDYLSSELKQGRLSSQEFSALNKFTKDISKYGNSVEKLLNSRTTFDRAIGDLYVNNPSAGQVIKQNMRRIITDKVEGIIAQNKPELLESFRNANRAYSQMSDALDDLRKVSDISAERVFKSQILAKGTNEIRSAKKLMGDDNIKIAGYNYIAENIFDEAGNIIGDKFKNVIKKIGNDRGKEIFGIEEWKTLEKMPQAIGLAQFKLTDGIKNVLVLQTINQIDSFINKNKINNLLKTGEMTTGFKTRIPMNDISASATTSGAVRAVEE